MHYPVIVEPDGFTWLVRFPDIPEALTCGSNREAALTEAREALVVILETYMKQGRPVPLPTALWNSDLIELPRKISEKIRAHNAGLALSSKTPIRIARRRA